MFWRECVGLASRGYDVTLLARADQDSDVHGVHVVGLRTYGSRMARMTVGVWRALVEAVRTRADLYHAHDPELIPALLLLRLGGKRVVYDAHEWLSLQVRSKDYLPAGTRTAALMITRGLEKAIGVGANQVVTVSDACATPFPARKVTVVANYPELDRFAPVVAPPQNSEVPAFAYLGGISAIRGIEQLVDAIDELNTTDEASLVLVGPFESQELQDRVSARPGWQHVRYLGVVPHTEVASRLAGARAGLATFLPTPNNVIGSPNKVFEYLALGLPLILSDFPAWRQMLTGVDCALFVDPADPTAIAEAMRWLVRHPQRAAEMGAAGRAAVEGRFNWDAQLDNLVGAYRRMGIAAS